MVDCWIRYAACWKTESTAEAMPRTPRLLKTVILGASAVGKTSVIEQMVFGFFEENSTFPTVEDTYEAWVETERAQREKIRIYDTAGLNVESPKMPSHYLHIADGFILVFSVCCEKSFKLVNDLKKEIDRVRGKDFPILVLGTKVDLVEDRKCNHDDVMQWSDTEKVKLFEVLTSNRKTLQAPVTWLVKKMVSCCGKNSSQTDIKKIFNRRSANKSKDGSDS